MIILKLSKSLILSFKQGRHYAKRAINPSNDIGAYAG